MAQTLDRDVVVGRGTLFFRAAIFFLPELRISQRQILRDCIVKARSGFREGLGCCFITLLLVWNSIFTSDLYFSKEE
jgi:hypothetical protein